MALGKRTAATVRTDSEQNYVALPGSVTRVILEFPSKESEKSAIIILDDVMTVSFSSARTKAPVTPLGQVVPDGFGLGSRTVAGSMVRSVFTVDRLTELQSKVYLANQEEIANRLQGIDNSLPSGAPIQDRTSIVQDDLTAFNIHMYSITEAPDTSGLPRERFDTIFGATIINTGQVYSIEDLISESTFSFQAKAHRASSNITDYSSGFSNNTAYKTVSSLLGL